MVTFELSQIVTWLYNLFVYYIFGDAILAGIFGFVFLIIMAVKMGLGADSLLVLMIFSSIMFSSYVFEIDVSIIFAIAILLGIISMAVLKLIRR